jgi:type IV pilus assembly protein PilP
MTARLSWIVALACASALAGCDGGEPQQVAPAKAAAAKATAAKAATAEAPSDQVAFSYNPIGKRDPFRSYLADIDQLQRDEPKRRLEPTEMFDIDQFRLTGLVTGTSQPKAMVEDPTGRGHVVKIGTRLGKKGGVVTRITTTGMVITEEFRTPTGEKTRVPINVPLPQPELDMATEQ